MTINGNAIGVLLIEDNPGDARLIQEYLSEEGQLAFHVAAEHRLADGLDRLSQTDFEVVLLDLGLPDSNGLDTYHRFKKAYPAMPVVVLSGLDDAETAIHAMRGGAQDYLVKGNIDGATLSRSIRYAVERRRVDNALQRQVDILGSIMQSIEDGIVVVSPTGACVTANEQALKILQTDQPLVNVRSWRSSYGLRRFGQEGNFHDDFFLHAHARDVQFELKLSASARSRYIEVSVSPLRLGSVLDLRGSVLVLRDVTDRHDEELAQVRLATALEQTANPVIISDPDGTIVYVNKAFTDLMQYSKEEIIGANPRVLKSGRVADATYNELWETISNGGVWHGRLINRSKSGGMVEVDTTITPIRNPAGHITNFVATQRDVTNEVALEYQLRALQRMEAFGQLTSGIAHDFNNMLTTICGYAEFVAAELPKNDPLLQDVQQIQNAGKSAANLTRQLLAFSRQQVLQPSRQDLNKIVANMQRMFKRIVPENIQLLTELAPTVFPIWADTTQLEQVIMNLVVNACDAMPQGGTLCLRTDNIFFDKDYTDRHLDVHEGAYALLAVSDTGTGMPPDTQEHIFEPFFTTKEVGKGTGLGLATVYGIVRQSSGSIWVYSEPGYGTTFKAYFPRWDGGGDDEEVSNHWPEAKDLYGDETILVVEDNESVRLFVVRALTEHGYTVLECRNGAEALALIQNDKPAVDLILTDVIMPEMGGLDFVRQLDDDMHRRAIYMSGYFEQSLYGSDLQNGTRSFIEKPFVATELLARVRETLDML